MSESITESWQGVALQTLVWWGNGVYLGFSIQHWTCCFRCLGHNVFFPRGQNRSKRNIRISFSQEIKLVYHFFRNRYELCIPLRPASRPVPDQDHHLWSCTARTSNWSLNHFWIDHFLGFFMLVLNHFVVAMQNAFEWSPECLAQLTCFTLYPVSKVNINNSSGPSRSWRIFNQVPVLRGSHSWIQPSSHGLSSIFWLAQAHAAAMRDPCLESTDDEVQANDQLFMDGFSCHTI